MFDLQIVPTWVKLTAAAVVLAALGAVIGAQRISLAKAKVGLSAAEATTAKVRQEWAEERVEQLQVSRETLQENQRLAALWHARQLEAYRAKADENLRNERLAAAARDELDRVRSDIATFAAGGGGQAAGDSLAACRQDAATLGELLDGALRADAAHTRAAEEHATDVRTLLNSWPVNP